MNLALDAIIIISAALIIISAAKKGLIRSVMGLIKSVASLIAAYAFTPVLALIIEEKFLLGRMTENIAGTLKGWSLDTNTDLYNLDRLASSSNDEFGKILERYGVGLDSISAKLRGLVGVGENEVTSIAEDIASPVSHVLSSVISFILIFAAAFLVLSLLTFLLDAIFKLPVLHGINRALGVCFGIIEAVVVASVLAVALSVLVTALGSISPDFFGAQVVDRTLICKALLNNNLFSFIGNVLGA